MLHLEGVHEEVREIRSGVQELTAAPDGRVEVYNRRG